MSDQLAALAESCRELSGASAALSGIERILGLLGRRLGVRRSALYLAHQESRTLEIRACYGLAREQFRDSAVGVVSRAASDGRPIMVPLVHADAAASADFADSPEWTESEWSLIAVPVAMSGRFSGALAAYFPPSDVLEAPSLIDVLEVVAALLAQSLCARHLEDADQAVRLSGHTPAEYANMIGLSAPMRQIYEQIRQVARTNATTLIRGESGTGKELVAHAIHSSSMRAEQAFVRVNCAALPETLFESELFGHERGAFTGAHAKKKGRFELAEGGTLFLDEIGELPLSTQVKLLRVLQSREFERLGGTETLRTDIRLIAATNKNLERAVSGGGFREDLYYRLNVFTMTLPALRDRRVDIPALAEYFLAKFAGEHTRSITRISGNALDLLCQYPWPGNVRELENVLERAVVVCDGSVIRPQHLPETIRFAARDNPDDATTLAAAVAKFERRMIEDALYQARGNASRAARTLGTTERIVRYKAAKYGIAAERFRG